MKSKTIGRSSRISKKCVGISESINFLRSNLLKKLYFRSQISDYRIIVSDTSSTIKMIKNVVIYHILT